MQLQKLQAEIKLYKKQLKAQRFYEQAYKWEILKNFQDNWDLDAPDLAAMYDASLESTHTRRWWNGENFQAKEMMIHFLKASPDFGRRMFADLFNEEKDIEGRISRFQFACDVLLEEHKVAYPLTIDNNHFHSDNHMISLYLGLQMPQHYTVIFYPDFARAMERIGMLKIPAAFDFSRFFKICRTLYTFLSKEEGLLEIHHSKLDLQKHYLAENLWLAQDFYAFLARD